MLALQLTTRNARQEHRLKLLVRDNSCPVVGQNGLAKPVS